MQIYSVFGSTPSIPSIYSFGVVAQLVERWPEEPSVVGSIPTHTTKYAPVRANTGNTCVDSHYLPLTLQIHVVFTTFEVMFCLKRL